MHSVIKALIEIDQKARQIVEDKKKFRNEERLRIAQDHSKLMDSYVNQAKKHIEHLQEEAEKQAEHELALARQENQKVILKIQEIYQANKQKWLDEIVAHCKEV